MADSGSGCSLLPSRFAPSVEPLPPNSPFRVAAVNRTVVNTLGTCQLTFSLEGLPNPFSWTFYVADITHPILGTDFLRTHGFAVDCVNNKLLPVPASTQSPQTTPATSTTMPCGHVTLTSDPFAPYQAATKQLMGKHPSLFQPVSTSAPVQHDVEHHIVTKGPPCHSRVRRLVGRKLEVAKRVFGEWERQGIVYRGESPYASPLHMAPKDDAATPWRPVGDYRQLNSQTIPDRYPMPNLTDLTSELHGTSVFSKLDLVCAFTQIPVAKDSQPKTAVITPFGLFLFRRMFFGQRNAAQTFQRLMDSIFQDLSYVKVYLDDILIASADAPSHLRHLETVFTRLDRAGLRLRPDKCLTFQRKVNFAGIEITSTGIRPIPGKVSAIAAFPRPETVKGLKRFLGMAGFYHRFVPGFSSLAGPLTDLTRSKAGKGNHKLSWNPDANTAFESLKKALQQAVTLSFPDPHAEIQLVTDASGVAAGAVLNQVKAGVCEPLAFFSAKFNDAESKKSAFDRELLAIYMALRHFSWLHGSPFVIKTDHKPLVHAMTMVNPTPQQTRWLSYISEFGAPIQHVSGADNVVADALSRTVCGAVSAHFDEELAQEQSADADLMSFIRQTSLPINELRIRDDITVFCDASRPTLRPYVPKVLRLPLFHSVHDLAHLSSRATIHSLSESYVWPGLKRDVKRWCRECIPCQQSKVTRHTKAPVGSIPSPGRFHTIHVDIVGPLPPSSGYRFLVTAIDRFTRWPEAIPVADITAATVASALISCWVCRFGVPMTLVSDRGSQFESALWSELMSQLGIERRRTTSYHPACNGAVERLHRTLKAGLRAHGSVDNWTASLPLVLLGIRTSLNDQGFTPAQAVFGSNIALPSHYFSAGDNSAPPADTPLNDLFATVRRFSLPARHHNAPWYLPPDIAAASHVWVRNDAPKSGLHPRYTGPYKVLARDHKTVTLNIHGTDDRVSVDRVKPAHLTDMDPPGTATSHAAAGAPPPGPTATASPSLGSVVLAKFPGWPPWPALVVSPDHTVLSRHRRPPDSLAVRFFGTDRLAYVARPSITPFVPNAQSKHRPLQRAFTIAQRYLSSSTPETRPLPKSVRFLSTSFICD